MDSCKTIKVKPWGEGQGDFVEINAEDFDPAKHKLLAGEAPANAEAPSGESVADAEPAPKRAPAKRKKGK